MTRCDRRGFLRTAACGTAAALSGWRTEAAEKPNVIIFFADDLGYNDIGCYGAEDMRTPNIDALAAAGTYFTQWYSNAPVCSPSRAALLTGRYPQRTGVANNVPSGLDSAGLKPDEITLAEAMRGLDYRTGLFGKWHQGSRQDSRPQAQGFEESFGFLSGCVDYYSHIYYWHQSGYQVPYHDLWRNGEEVWENGEYLTHLIAREASRFVRENKERPFFLYIPFNAPHYPMHAPKEYFERVKHINDPQRRTQAAMAAALDDSIGSVMKELDRQGLRDKTLILFISDNGPSSEPRNLLDDSRQKYHGGRAYPFKGCKGGLHEGGIREPAIVHWPGVIPSGQVIDEVGATMDVFPTVLKLAGGELPTDRPIDGKDIFPMITQKAKSPHEEIFWGLGEQRAVRAGDWKLLLNGKLDFEEKSESPVLLYNLKDDPGETKDLKEQHPDLVEKLKQRIAFWEKDVGAGS
ncbi:MAG: sulfatase-like hydrolase/transferase [Candidatus Omnitrophota bacterium]